MGQSTDGEISFGILFDEGHEFPWDKWAKGDEISWWRHINGYRPPHDPDTLYDEHGEYRPGVQEDDSRFDENYQHRKTWDANFPMPFELVNYCSGECPMYILAVSGSVVRASRGDPLAFDPSALGITHAAREAFFDFITKYIPSVPGPKWYLSSYWG